MFYFTVNNEVFPQIQNGFLDKEPIIREKSVIAMIHLASKLNQTNLDETVVCKISIPQLFKLFQSKNLLK